MTYPHRDNIPDPNKIATGENEKSLAVSFPQYGFLSMDKTTFNNSSNRKKPLDRTIGQARRAYCHAPSYSHSGQNPLDVFNKSLNIEQDQVELPITLNPAGHSLEDGCCRHNSKIENQARNDKTRKAKVMHQIIIYLQCLTVCLTE